jgi:uncharacterized CHY-type Zn-finger protein
MSNMIKLDKKDFHKIKHLNAFYIICPKCSTELSINHIYNFNFCPSCGVEFDYNNLNLKEVFKELEKCR